MILYGVCDLETPELGVSLWFETHEGALAEIDRMLQDEPSWADCLTVLRVDFSRGEQELLASSRL